MSKTVQYTLDFGNRRPDQREVLIAEYAISTKVKRLLGIIKQVKYRYHKLYIDQLEIPPALSISNPDKLIEIKLRQGDRRRRGGSLGPVLITSYEFPFEVVFRPSLITDCTDNSLEQVEISFTICGKKTSQAQAQVFGQKKIKLNLKKAPSVFRANFVPDQDFANGFELRRTNGLKAGHLKVETVAPVQFAHPVDKVAIQHWATKERHQSIFRLAETKRELEESNPSTSGPALREAGEEVESDLEVTSGETGLVLRGLTANNIVSIPVYLDLETFPNPIATENLKVEFSILSETVGVKSRDSFSARLELLPDTRKTELLASLKSAETEHLLNGSSIDLPEKLQWMGQQHQGRRKCFSLRLGNRAESGSGLIQIRKLQAHLEVGRRSQSTIKGNEESNQPPILPTPGAEVDTYLDSLFEWSPNFASDLEFPSQPRSQEELSLYFRHSAIQDIPHDLANLSCTLSLEYRVTEEGVTTEWQVLRQGIHFCIEKNPGRYWLAIDFGTSATVAGFDNGEALTAGQGQLLLNLQDALANLQDPEDFGSNETGSPFLSSNILLDDKKTLHASQYAERLVKLSPGVRKLEREALFDRVLPYLKSLVGHKDLPDPNKRLDELKYRKKEGNKLISFKDQRPGVNDILLSTYTSLLHDFILPQIADKQEANKVVLSIPNTFTPYHLSQIKSMINSEFDGFKTTYTTFVSESDAVACHYLEHWGRLNADRPAAERQQLQDRDEYVLVYDMGAGTTDLTYLRIRQLENGKRSVEVLGKLGKFGAGNLLDRVLAEIVYEQNQEKVNFNPFTRASGGASDMTIRYKQLIRDEVKPRLNTNESYALTQEQFSDGGQRIVTEITEDLMGSNQEVLRHEKMLNFIYSHADELFEHFFKLFNVQNGRVIPKGQFPLNTLLFTGRSVQFKSLREAVLNGLKTWSVNTEPFVIREQASEKLKSAVVEGALVYALKYRDASRSNLSFHSQNVQARYGILCQTATGGWRFKELLNPATQPIETNPRWVDGLTIYPYDTDVHDADPENTHQKNYVDLTHSITAYLVQSYANDTAAAYTRRDFSLVTKMAAFSANEVSGDASRVSVRIRIDKNNTLRFDYGDQENDPSAPLRFNPEEVEQLRKSMWPYWMD